MSLRQRFGMLERRRPTREAARQEVAGRFETLEQTAAPVPAASTVSAREEPAGTTPTATAGAATHRPGRDDGKDRLLALLLIAWAGPRLLDTLGRLVAMGLALLLFVVLLATGVWGRGCQAITGGHADPAASSAPP